MSGRFDKFFDYAYEKGRDIAKKFHGNKGDKMDKKGMNIESYDGQDAFYTGTDEEYEEFLKNEKADTDATKKANMQKVFNQLDQNGDGKVDYKELTAMLAMYDANSDGEFSKEEFAQGGQSMLNGTAAQTLQNKYNELFPKKTTTTTEEE